MSEVPADISASSGFEITPRSVAYLLFVANALAFETRRASL
jgi:hypothetical protein